MIGSIGNFFGSLFGGGSSSAFSGGVSSPYGPLTKTGPSSYSYGASTSSSGGLFGQSSLMSAGSFGSSLMSIYASKKQGKLAQQAYNIKARQENLFARQIEINAEEQANQVRDQLLNDMSSATAFFAANGMSSSGTAMNAQIKSRRNAALDIGALNRNASTQALFMRGQATQTGFEGKAARIRSRMTALQEIPNLARSGASLYGALGGSFGG